MVDPVPVILAQYLGQRSLRGQKAALRVSIERLTPRCDSNLHLFPISCDRPLVSDDLAITFMSKCRALDLLALVIKEAKRILLPGTSLHKESTE